MREIKLYKSPLKSLKLVVLSSIFVLPSIWFIMNKEDEIILWFCLCFFGLGFVLGLLNMFDRRAQIIINKVGIWDRTTKQDIIKWEFIENAYDVNVHKQLFISFKTNKKFVPKKKMYKWAKFLNKSVGAQNLNINVSYIKADIEKLLTLINILKNEPIENREQVIEIFRSRI